MFESFTHTKLQENFYIEISEIHVTPINSLLLLHLRIVFS